MNAVSPVLNNSLIDQWFLCANACFEIPMDIQKDLRSLWTKEVPTSIIEWGYQFEKDLYGAHYGYSSLSAQHDPYTEICIETLLQEKGILQYCKPHIRQPTLCISHDVDHLSISGKLILKRLISERQLISYRGSTKSFLPSLRKLLKLSAPLSRNTKSVATVFAASPLVSKNPLYWPMQWLIDPSYNVVHSRFNEFSELLKEFQCDVGLHGSFYSLSKNFLEKEKENLEVALGQDITLLRQHWLHLPGKEAWNVIGESKFQIDSTLGWNGNVGFRGGMIQVGS